MANYFKARILIKRLKDDEDASEDFDRLWSVLKSKHDREELLYEDFELDPSQCSFVDEDPELDGDDCIIMSLLFRLSEMTPEFISQFAESLHEGFYVDIDMVYCDENENTTSVGLFRKVNSIEFYDGSVHDDIENYVAWEDFEYVTKDHFYRPKDEKQRHEAFLMSWDGYRCIHNSEQHFFNQLGLDDDYFMIKEDEDDSGRLPSLSDWLPKAYTTFEEFESEF